MKAFRSLSLLIIAALILAACAPATPALAPTPTAAAPTAAPTPMPEPTTEPTAAPQTLVDLAVADGRFTTLVSAVQAAGLVETLSGPGPFTVFAPTDEAFAKLPAGTLDSLLADPEGELKRILTYHVVPGKVMAADVAGLTEAESVEGSPIGIRVEGDKVFVNDAQVILTDIEASNGVIHVIDSVILPPAAEEVASGNIVEIAAEDGRFTTLLAAAEAAGLVETLQGEGPLTVFAPTDEAFAKLPAGTVETLLADPEQLRRILLYHVVAGQVLAADVAKLESADTVAGLPVSIRLEGENVFINEAQVLLTDIAATNGVIHVIDSVLIPEAEGQSNIVETAVADGRFTTLVAAVQAAGLAETLSGPGPFTVFAPTDDAFKKLPAGTLETLLAEPEGDLKNILLYHVVEGKVLAADVVKLMSAETVLGEPVSIRVEGDKVFINESQVILTDIETSNGVIHVIDSVLLPES